MKITVTDAIDVGEIVWKWSELHPDMKKDFRITHEYIPKMQAFRLTMERAYTDETKYGMVRLLPEDILCNMVCPGDYINAVLEDMYKKLTESEVTERTNLRDYVQHWLLIYADPFCDRKIKVKVESFDNGYAVDLIKESDGKSISARGRITRNHEEAWGTFASDLYKKFKEREKKEMDIEFAAREDNDTRLKMAKAAVVTWYNEQNQSRPIGIEDVYIVWFCKVLQNWKALAGTHHSDGMYYEITFDGNNKLVYFDAYKKWQNVQMSGRELEKGVC